MAKKDENSFEGRLVAAFQGENLKIIAQKLGEDYSTFWNYATERRAIPPKILVRIAKLTNCSLNWLLTGEGEKLLNNQAFLTFNDIFEKKIREIVRDELAGGAAEWNLIGQFLDRADDYESFSTAVMKFIEEKSK